MLSALVDNGHVNVNMLPESLIGPTGLRPFNELPDQPTTTTVIAALTEAGVDPNRLQDYIIIAGSAEDDLQHIVYAGEKNGNDAFNDVLMNNKFANDNNSWPIP